MQSDIFIWSKTGTCQNPKTVFSWQKGNKKVVLLLAEYKGKYDVSYNYIFSFRAGGRYPWKKLCTHNNKQQAIAAAAVLVLEIIEECEQEGHKLPAHLKRSLKAICSQQLTLF